MNPFIVQEDDRAYKKDPATLKEALQQRDHWKDKYYELMEKYLILVEERK